MCRARCTFWGLLLIRMTLGSTKVRHQTRGIWRWVKVDHREEKIKGRQVIFRRSSKKQESEKGENPKRDRGGFLYPLK